MRKFRLWMAALVIAMTAAACSGDITGPEHEGEQKTPYIGSGSGT